MFLIFMFIIATIAGNVLQGQSDFARTHLTAAIDSTITTIPVASTVGFPDVGVIVIEDEHIGYSAKTTTPPYTVYGTVVQPLLRHIDGTSAAPHAINKQVSTVPGAVLNASAAYYTAVIADSAGLQAFIAKPVAFFQLVGGFLFLPLSFLGSDLQILTVFWAVFGIGMIIALFINMAGGRRV